MYIVFIINVFMILLGLIFLLSFFFFSINKSTDVHIPILHIAERDCVIICSFALSYLPPPHPTPNFMPNVPYPIMIIHFIYRSIQKTRVNSLKWIYNWILNWSLNSFQSAFQKLSHPELSQSSLDHPPRTPAHHSLSTHMYTPTFTGCL